MKIRVTSRILVEFLYRDKLTVAQIRSSASDDVDILIKEVNEKIQNYVDSLT